MTIQQFQQQDHLYDGKPAHLFAFGLGYSALALIDELSARGWACGGTVRAAQKAEALSGSKLTAQVFNTAEAVRLPDGAHWLISVPPGPDGCPIFAKFSDKARAAATITYLSTTGVYGDLQGGWAFEWTQPAPTSKRASRRLSLIHI